MAEYGLVNEMSMECSLLTLKSAEQLTNKTSVFIDIDTNTVRMMPIGLIDPRRETKKKKKKSTAKKTFYNQNAILTFFSLPHAQE